MLRKELFNVYVLYYVEYKAKAAAVVQMLQIIIMGELEGVVLPVVLYHLLTAIFSAIIPFHLGQAEQRDGARGWISAAGLLPPSTSPLSI